MGYSNLRGVDQDEGLVNLARSLNLPAFVGDALEELSKLEDSSVASIFALDFLEHLELVGAVNFCREARRVLSPGGRLICRAPNAEGPFGSHDRYNDLTHLRAFTSGSAVQLLQLGGFAVGDVEIRDEAPVAYKWQNLLRRGFYELATRSLALLLDVAGFGKPGVWTQSMWFSARKT